MRQHAEGWPDGRIRSHFATCPTKLVFPSRQAAAKRARVSQSYMGRMTPYRCACCGKWHFGHEGAA